MDFDGQSIIIAGAAGRLGSAIARELAARGADLTLASHSQAPLDALASSLTTKNPPAIVVADARTKQDCERIAAAALERFGRIDALANTVGTFKTAPIAGGAAADLWSDLMALNALSALHLSTAVIPAMKARGYGRIVHTAAGAGLKAFADASVYSASKAALLRITEALAEEHKNDGITANCVMPGTIDTPENRAAMPKADPSKWTKAEAIARVVAFLISAEAGGVTGAAVPVTNHG